MKILFMIICYLFKNEKEFVKKALKRDLYLYTHIGVLRYAFKVYKFCEEILNNNECMELLCNISEEKDINEQLIWGYVMQRKIEFDAKNGNVCAAKYIKYHKKHYGSVFNLVKEVVEVTNRVPKDLIPIED